MRSRRACVSIDEFFSILSLRLPHYQVHEQLAVYEMHLHGELKISEYGAII